MVWDALWRFSGILSGPLGACCPGGLRSGRGRWGNAAGLVQAESAKVLDPRTIGRICPDLARSADSASAACSLGDGFDVVGVQRHGAFKQRPGIQFLLMSGETLDDLPGLGVDRDRIPFLPKPFQPEQLLKLIRDALE